MPNQLEATENLPGSFHWPEKIEARFIPQLAAKLERVPEERRISPDLLVAGPTIEALKFAGEKEELRDLFANLLVTAMDSDTARFAHPAYVEIIKQLSQDEAKIIACLDQNVEGEGAFAVVDIRRTAKDGGYSPVHRNLTLFGQFAGCEHLELVPAYLDNLCRLEILAWSPDGQRLTDDGVYEELEADPTVQGLLAEQGEEAYIHQRAIWITEFGKQFISACAGVETMN